MEKFLNNNNKYTQSKKDEIKREIEQIKKDTKLSDQSNESFDNLYNMLDLEISGADISQKLVWDAYVDFQDLYLFMHLNLNKDVKEIYPNIYNIVTTNQTKMVNQLVNDISQKQLKDLKKNQAKQPKTKKI